MFHVPCFMFHDLYQHLPQYINPIAFTVGSFSVRWYAISYIVGFLTIYFILMWRVKKGEIILENKKSKIKNQNEIQNSKLENSKKIQDTKYEIQNTVFDFLLVAFFSSLIGGRLGYVLFYNLSYFISHPLAIISPYDNGNFTGIYGMSYHGALVGVLIGSYVFLRVKKINFWLWADFVVPAVPLGYFFGRIGNFLNGELYGRITNSSLGMYFTNSSALRYPSQLAEAFLEGLVLFAILWKMRKRKLSSGALFSAYLIGYGSFRILAEEFREPDPQIGFILGYFTLGQLLSLAMIIAGLIIFVSKKRKE